MLVVLFRGRLKNTLFNVGFILSEMKSGRPAYLGNEELDVRSEKALRLPHGVIIAVGTIVFLDRSAPISASDAYSIDSNWTEKPPS